MNGGTKQFSVVVSALGDDVREAARRARQAGFAGILIDVYAPALDLTTLSRSGQRELRRLLESQQQKLPAVRCDLGGKGFGLDADVDREITRLDRALQVAAALGAQCLCTDLGPLPPAPAQAPKAKPAITREQAGLIILPSPSSPPTLTPAPEPAAPPPDPAFVAQLNRALAELCARADRSGTAVALSSSLAGFASLAHALGSVGCPWFGVDLDPVAMLRDAWDVDEVFSQLGAMIRHVRARDAVVGADRRTRPAPIGQGSVDWNRLLGALDEAAYAGMMTIDPIDVPDRHTAAILGRKYLESVSR